MLIIRKQKLCSRENKKMELWRSRVGCGLGYLSKWNAQGSILAWNPPGTLPRATGLGHSVPTPSPLSLRVARQVEII
jgi:hypothetical protein